MNNMGKQNFILDISTFYALIKFSNIHSWHNKTSVTNNSKKKQTKCFFTILSLNPTKSRLGINFFFIMFGETNLHLMDILHQ